MGTRGVGNELSSEPSSRLSREYKLKSAKRLPSLLLYKTVRDGFPIIPLLNETAFVIGTSIGKLVNNILVSVGISSPNSTLFIGYIRDIINPNEVNSIPSL